MGWAPSRTAGSRLSLHKPLGALLRDAGARERSCASGTGGGWVWSPCEVDAPTRRVDPCREALAAWQEGNRRPGPPTAQTELQKALDAAIASGPGAGWRVPICVVALANRDGSGPPCVFAAARCNENHYTASLAKVHAMYAAFQLRETL